MIPHSKPTLISRDFNAVIQVLKSGYISQGEYVKRFEDALSEFIGVKGGVATNSGTSALHLAMMALEIGRGDEVIIPSYVCTALLNVIHYTGATPRIVDIETNSFNIDVKRVEESLNKRTKAIIVPHIFGLPANLEGLLSLRIPLIEDCAQALGGAYKGKYVGSFGILSIFSFYATKVIATGEGGMVLSNSESLLKKVKDLCDYDNRDDYKIRFNYKMTDVQGALGISQLKRLPLFLKRRRAIAKRYSKELVNFPAVLPTEFPDREHIFYRYVIRIEKDIEIALKRIKREGVYCERPVWRPLHHYLNLSDFPKTDIVFKSALSIPIYPSLTNEEMSRVIKTVRKLESPIIG
ncbi:MAG: DegT/DnrJ/EryC1/StrS family aminotransferase [Thermodesulfobacteriota bacterium]|nr:DegT/DnrJ/EryC1/StrS family aminotransferase [Thermodesulfobacteriota bacterium]